MRFPARFRQNSRDSVFCIRMNEFIRALPKAELHLHLEGTVKPELLMELSAKVDAQPLSINEARDIYLFDDFSGFLHSFSKVSRRIVGPEEYELITSKMIENLAAQGVVHAEVYFSLGEIFRSTKDQHLSDDEIFEKTFQAVERARIVGEQKYGTSIYWIIAGTRNEGFEEASRVFKTAAKFREKYPSIVGIGLGGDERVYASEPFRQLYQDAKAAQLRLTNHAGENTPSSFIWEALSIGSERLGHACSAIQDPELIKTLKEKQTPLELNPSSNVSLKNCPDIKSHPLRALFDDGLLVTLNSDDPAFFGSDVENEYRLAHSEQGFTRKELQQLAENSFTASFLPEHVKQQWIDKIRAME